MNAFSCSDGYVNRAVDKNAEYIIQCACIVVHNHRIRCFNKCGYCVRAFPSSFFFNHDKVLLVYVNLFISDLDAILFGRKGCV